MVTEGPGRRHGRTLLKLEHVQARHAAIAKLEVRVVPSDVSAWIPGRITGRDIDPRVPVELPGHHLQRASAENA